MVKPPHCETPLINARPRRPPLLRRRRPRLALRHNHPRCETWFGDTGPAAIGWGHIVVAKELFCASAIMLVLQHPVVARSKVRQRPYQPTYKPTYKPSLRTGTAAPTTPTGSTTRATRASRGATTSPRSPTKSRRRPEAQRESPHASGRVARKCCATTPTPSPRSLPIGAGYNGRVRRRGRGPTKATAANLRS